MQAGPGQGAKVAGQFVAVAIKQQGQWQAAVSGMVTQRHLRVQQGQVKM